MEGWLDPQGPGVALLSSICSMLAALFVWLKTHRETQRNGTKVDIVEQTVDLYRLQIEEIRKELEDARKSRTALQQDFEDLRQAHEQCERDRELLNRRILRLIREQEDHD